MRSRRPKAPIAGQNNQGLFIAGECKVPASLQHAPSSDYLWHLFRLFPGQFALVADSVDSAAQVGVE